MKALLVIDIPEHREELSQMIVRHIETSHYDKVFFTEWRNVPGSNFVRQLSYSARMDEPEIPAAFARFITSDNYFIKHTYSALKQPELRKALENYKQLDLCGVDTDACVLATAYDAFDQNFAVNILFDLCETKNAQLQNAAKLISQRNIKSN